MFGFFSLGENLLDGPTIEDLFEAIAKNDQQVIAGYFRKTFDDVAGEIAKHTGVNKLSQAGGDDITPAIETVVGDLPFDAITEKNKDFLAQTAQIYENRLGKCLIALQKLNGEISEFNQSLLSPERIQEIDEGSEMTEAEEAHFEQMLKVEKPDIYQRLQKLNEMKSELGTCRSIAYFLESKIELALEEQSSLQNRSFSCTIL